MDIERAIKENIEGLLERLETDFSKIKITQDKEDETLYHINIESDDPSILIGYHGENIMALQHILKVLVWRKADQEDFKILLDVDDYRKNQEENVLALAERKVEGLRQSGNEQKLPPMSPYFRRVIHLHLMKPEFEDIETYSVGDGDHRRVVIKSK